MYLYLYLYMCMYMYMYMYIYMQNYMYVFVYMYINYTTEGRRTMTLAGTLFCFFRKNILPHIYISKFVVKYYLKMCGKILYKIYHSI